MSIFVVVALSSESFSKPVVSGLRSALDGDLQIVEVW
jgi:hypothetical protein